jgi:hypothetical protein
MPFFFDQADLCQFLEGISQLPILAVPERRNQTRGLEATVIAQFNHREREDRCVTGLDQVEEVDVEFEGRRAEGA